MSWTINNPFRGNAHAWLGADGSLSARLAAAGQRFSVQLLAHGRQAISLDEAQGLGLSGACAGYVREVVLRVDGVAVVFARSVTPYAASRGPWRAICGLGLRPLADVLFTRKGITRSPITFAVLKASSPLRGQVAHGWQQAGGGVLASGRLPARRSVFTRGGAPLLVMEVFASPQLPWAWSMPRRISSALVQFRKNHED
jgi:chorismate--pyruvate lyase